MIGLESLSHLTKDKEPPFEHLVLWKFTQWGIPYSEFVKTPIPIILAVMGVESYYAEQEKRNASRK